jgi:hypothetical protein
MTALLSGAVPLATHMTVLTATINCKYPIVAFFPLVLCGRNLIGVQASCASPDEAPEASAALRCYILD